MLLEICANSFLSAANAAAAGADRIELCQELQVGGITPSWGLLRHVRERLDIPVHVLIRPRAGNFVYSDDEFAIMKHDIQACRELGCAGIVSGVLYSDGRLDVERTRELIEVSGDLSFTFHRAFDVVVNPSEVVEQLIEMGADRILSSGGETTAIEGLNRLRDWQQQAGKRLDFMPGGGINSNNASLFQAAGFSAIHTSASTAIPAEAGIFGSPLSYSDEKKILKILEILGR